MILADSNIIIYAVSGRYPQAAGWFIENIPAVSAISMVEVLGYSRLNPAEKSELEQLFSRLTILYPPPGVFQIAVGLRQQHSLSLGDALIASTALYFDCELATHNTADFNWIEGLRLVDPMV